MLFLAHEGMVSPLQKTDIYDIFWEWDRRCEPKTVKIAGLRLWYLECECVAVTCTHVVAAKGYCVVLPCFEAVGLCVEVVLRFEADGERECVVAVDEAAFEQCTVGRCRYFSL